jgi:O-antigen/teichoic acid export membrane protein
LAVSQVTRTALTVGGQVGFALVLKEAGAGGLIAGFALGLVTATFVIWPIRAAAFRAVIGSPRQAFKATCAVLQEYRSYIRVDVVNVLISLSALVAYPIFVLASFGFAEAGLYAVASRITFIPIDVLGAAISTVYFQRFAKAVREGSGTTRLYLVTLFGALFAAIAIAGFLSVAAGPFVDLIFGDDWVRTGVIILCLLPTFVSRFVTVCIGSTPLALKRPDLLLYWNLAQLAIISATLWLSHDQTPEVFLLYSGFTLLAASAVYAFFLLTKISRTQAVKAA